jgi:asparagine synthase (glutamine-hydrolysing)
MHAQGGCFSFDGAPVPSALAQALRTGLAESGPDGTGQHTAFGLLMVSCALHVTPEDAHERQPFLSAAGHVLTWDGRLDNRGALLAALGASTDKSSVVTDVEIVAAAYTRWGIDGFAKLIGDWSLALWDSHEQRLVLASDYLGVRPLYYHIDARCAMWCSQAGLLAEQCGCLDELEPKYVAGFLMWGTPPELTPYRGVRSVPSAHAVILDRRGHAQLRRFWDIPTARLRYAREADYDDHMVACFTDAVSTRMRTTRPVWSQLSGGLDSSSVTCMAHALIRDGRVPASQLRTVTSTSSSSSEWSERPFVEAVERHCGLSTHYIDVDARPLIPPPGDSPHHTHWSNLITQDLMGAEGARVLLSGRMGDTVMGHEVENLEAATEELLAWHPWSYLKQVYEWCLVAQLPLAQGLLHSLVPLMPARLQETFDRRRVTKRHANTDPNAATGDDAAMFSLRPEFARSVRVLYPAYAELIRGKALPGHRNLVRTICRSAVSHRLRPMGGLTRIVLTYPFTHRPLVEFVLSIPSAVLYQPGRSRLLMRRAFASFVPDRILSRFSKGYYAPAELRQLRRVAGSVLPRVSQMHVVQHGYIEPASLTRRLQKLMDGSTMRTGNLTDILRLEAWFEARAQRAGGEIVMPAASLQSTS